MRTCLVLGAGATLANALHFHGERMVSKNPPLDYTFFEKIAALGISVPTELRAHAARSVGPDPFKLRSGQPATRMEEFFRDLFSDFQEAPKGGPAALAYEQLVDVYVRVLRETTDWMGEDSRKGGPIGRLISAAAEASDTVTIITFNQDLVIENEIVKRARLASRWCLQKGYGAFGSTLAFAGPTRAKNFRTHGPACNHTLPITVLKLHGSLNWYVRMNGRHPSKAVLQGLGATPRINCTLRRAVPEKLRWTKGRPSGRGRTSWYTWPVVIPPIHGKEPLIRQLLPAVWSDADTALRAADRIVFVGYSLPLLDVSAERLFKRTIASNTSARWVDVVNPAADAAARYASIATPTPVHWYSDIGVFMQEGAFG